jgi:hypothetical protein
MHKTIIAAIAVLLAGAGVCFAQPPGITRDMIERALPLEGSASCFTAAGERRARETASSRFRRSRRVIPGERSSR